MEFNLLTKPIGQCAQRRLMVGLGSVEIHLELMSAATA